MSWAYLAAETTSAWWWRFLSHPLAIAILAGVISASITARWALRRHRSTQLWDEKFRMYTRLFEALHDADRWHELEFDKYYDGGRPDDVNAWLADSAGTLVEVQRAHTIGPFLLTRKARQALGDFLEAFYDRHSRIGEYCDGNFWFGTYITGLAGSIRRFAESLAPIARRDLEEDAGMDAFHLLGWLRRRSKEHNAKGKD